ncbi:PQQ-binding-like beta-propeller repeat protein [Roseateles sp.]|uniref:outer membrane protein assembly factor BamB family protein n=1 Tax=Roseateles sp. TaxID=1971397 RepID=UPI0039EA0630
MRRLAFTALLGPAMSTAASHAADWPTFMGDAARSGANAGTGKAPGGFQLAWEYDLHAAVAASPVAAGGLLFVAAEDGNLHAIDIASRQLRWLFHADAGIASTPAVADGLIYFLSRDGQLHALDAASGAPRWSFRTGGEARFAAHGMFGLPRDGHKRADPWDFYLSSPLVADGKVVFGSSDEHVYALDAKTGAMVWSYKSGGMVHAAPARADSRVIVGAWDSALYALDLATGALAWRHQTGADHKDSIMLGIQAAASVDGDMVYAGSRDGFLYALDAATGQLRWRHDAKGSWVPGTAAINASQVFVPTSDAGLLTVLDKRSGRKLYDFPTQVWTFASPILVGDSLVVATMDGQVHQLDAASGKPLWRFMSPERLANARGILDAEGKFDNQRLYGTRPDEMVSALEHVKRLGAFIASPAWVQGHLITVDALGRVRAFRPMAKS